MVMIGLLCGFAIGVAAAVIRHLFDTRIRNGADIAQVTDAALLGTIPVLPGSSGRAVTVVAPRSVASEAYRRLQTNLQFLNASAPARCIVITRPSAARGSRRPRSTSLSRSPRRACGCS